ncbi:MAG: LPS export ABC transporter periplasmic protein LptC [Leptospirales bacterium]
MTKSIFLFLLLFCLHCGTEDAGFRKVDGPPEKGNTDIVIQNFHATGKNDKRVLWTLVSDRAYINNKTGIVLLDKVNLEYFDKKNKKTIIISERGVLHQKKRIMILDDKVKVYSPNGRKLYTNHLVWEEKTQKLHTDAPVKIYFPGGDSLNGQNLKADMNLNKIVVDQPIGQVQQK